MNTELIARRVAEEISDKHGISVKFAPEDVRQNRGGSISFSQGVEENHGIFKMIIAKAAINVQVQESRPKEDDVPYRYWVQVNLGYEHTRGSTNGYVIGELWLNENYDIIESTI